MSDQWENPLPVAADDPEPDTNQLAPEDTLDFDLTDDPQGDSYAVPDQPRFGLYDETEEDQFRGETISRELAAEEPEVWDLPEPAARGERDERVGRFTADADALGGRGNDIFADAGSEGSDRGGGGFTLDSGGSDLSTEEAAMHIIPGDD